MGQFFKKFFASLLALLVFALIGVFIMIGWIAVISSSFSAEKPTIGAKAVLYLDLGQTINEQAKENPLAGLSNDDQYAQPGLFDMLRLIKYAKTDSSIKGIYIKCADNGSGFATSDELRNALL